MSAGTDPAVLIHAFLKALEPNANDLPDLFGDNPVSSVPSGVPAPALRVRGLLSKLVEQNREVTLAFVRGKGAATQELISRRLFGSVYGRQLRELYRKAEIDRAGAQEKWFAGLSSADRTAIDAYCLAVAESIVRPHFPSPLPHCLHAPLARLAIEYSGIVRRAASECEEYRKSHTNENHAVVSSLMGAFRHEEEEAKSRVIGQWMRELPGAPEGAPAGPSPAEAGVRQSEGKPPKPASKMNKGKPPKPASKMNKGKPPKPASKMNKGKPPKPASKMNKGKPLAEGQFNALADAAKMDKGKPLAEGQFNALADAAKNLRLAGNERLIVEELCKQSGRVPLCDLATLLDWHHPFDGTWNAARNRLNKKLKKHGWKLRTHDRIAVAEALKSSARK